MATISYIEETVDKPFDLFYKSNMQTTLAGGGQIFKGLANLTAMDVDYEKLKLDAGYKDLQAANIEMQAVQEANYLRSEFTKRVGGYQYGTARRNVKMGEAGPNVEMSSQEHGYDQQKMSENVAYKAQQLRSEAERVRQGAEGVKKANDWKRIGGLFDSFGTASSIFKGFQFEKEIVRKEVIGPLPGQPVPKKAEVKPEAKVPIPEMKVGNVTTDGLNIAPVTTKQNVKEKPDTLTQIIYKDQLSEPVVQNIYMLANKGKTAEQIAKETGLPVEKIAVILKDKKRG